MAQATPESFFSSTMNQRPSMIRIFRWTGAVATGCLLAASAPPLQWQDAAWVAFLPLLASCRYATPGQAARLGFGAGAVCWLLSIHWLIHVSAVGWITLALYCALYVLPPAWLFSWWCQTQGITRWWSNLLVLFLWPAVWVGFEYVRSTLLTGFPWNPVGVSQYRNILVIQLAAWGGVYAVSFLVLLLNTAIALTVLQYVEHRGRRLRRPHVELMLALALLALAFTHGWRVLRHADLPATTLRVALIQPGIPQTEKWDRETVDKIYAHLRELTESALRSPGLDLVVWPETALPDDVRLSPVSYQLVRELATNGVPMLVGSMDTEWTDDYKPNYFNSSFLFDATGAIVQGYDKRHLVMFGEYVPLEQFVPFMNAMTPIEASFTPGITSTVFRLETPGVAFSALICFEDTVAALAREAVLNGARLLINQTNDAWFDPSAASRQHMAHCVFRCVENRVPAIRSGNTGVSCCIDGYGRVYDLLEDQDGNTVFPGFLNSSVRVPGAEHALTPYTRHGDLFGITCAFIALPAFFSAVWRSRKRVYCKSA